MFRFWFEPQKGYNAKTDRLIIRYKMTETILCGHGKETKMTNYSLWIWEGYQNDWNYSLWIGEGYQNKSNGLCSVKRQRLQTSSK
jgi:hypothetical protein